MSTSSPTPPPRHVAFFAPLDRQFGMHGVRDFALDLFTYSFVVDVANLGGRRPPVAVGHPSTDKKWLYNGEAAFLLQYSERERGDMAKWRVEFL